MIFGELRFLLFFTMAFVVHWALRWNTARKIWLLACSYLFYAVWDWRFLGLVIGSTVVDYFVALWMDRAGSTRSRRGWLWVSVVMNLGILGVFKYFDFFMASAADLSKFMGMEFAAPSLKLILPLGISFYTFEKLSYTIDVYRGHLKPTRSLLDLSLFVAFFPRLVAGPIMRASELLPQLGSLRSFANVNLRVCLTLFIVGYFKKACISDTIAPAVDQYFASPASYTALSGVIAVLLYAVQIYCDFSGYTDMARSAAGLLGYNLAENFRWPYLAASITDFWRRWHISLSSWLRDYLYISLGGSRGKPGQGPLGVRLFTYRNLMLTMLLGGLWHGAAWTFVVWGGLHGLALVVHKEWSQRVRTPRWLEWPRMIVGTLLTFYFVCLCWIFFRSPDLNTALHTAKAWVLLRSDGVNQISPQYFWVIGVLALLHFAANGDRLMRMLHALPRWVFALVAGVAAAAVLAMAPSGTRPFIYFQF